MLFDHLAVYTAVMICPIVYNTKFILFSFSYLKVICFFIDKRWLFKSFPMKTAVVCRSPSKFGVLNFVVSHTVRLIVFFP